jgi:hypothetical protein
LAGLTSTAANLGYAQTTCASKLITDAQQIPSLYRNPSAIDFELGSLADLILDPAVKAAVKAEIESRIQKSQVTGSASALAMWEGLGTLRTDTGSGAKASV